MDLATEPGLTSALRARGYQVRGPAGVGAGGTAWAANAPDGGRVVVGVLDLDLTLAERRAAVDRLDRLREVEHPHLARLVDVVAPIVGTFYAAPSPDAPPFVRVGDHVRPGSVLCIIEAMKLMNEIEAETAGVVREVLVDNGQPVEYGQVLFRIEPD